MKTQEQLECYRCKRPFVEVDEAEPLLCPSCLSALREKKACPIDGWHLRDDIYYSADFSLGSSLFAGARCGHVSNRAGLLTAVADCPECGGPVVQWQEPATRRVQTVKLPRLSPTAELTSSESVNDPQVKPAL